MSISLAPSMMWGRGRAVAVGAAVTVADTPPNVSRDGLLWFDLNSWRVFLSYAGQWWWIGGL